MGRLGRRQHCLPPQQQRVQFALTSPSAATAARASSARPSCNKSKAALLQQPIAMLARLDGRCPFVEWGEDFTEGRVIARSFASAHIAVDAGGDQLADRRQATG